MLIAAPETWKQPKCLSMEEYISTRWSIHSAKHYAALKRNKILTHITIWMSPEVTVLSE